ncbi:hypothetical protein J3R30DRAFT_3278159 [Lentinula aciculospora]|uniref:Uncharacterized protein n=1 Tax=Lentinula aciculospora TaxID=153920 RepID=A0A9W9DX37_9AGAR|nr:hypothetical protein J3R30DRAFT_3278159 [Lentinula aciculospora]
MSLHEREQLSLDHRRVIAHNRPQLPPLPDLRFELTYLRSIQPYVYFHRRPSKAELSDCSHKEITPMNKPEAILLPQSQPVEVIEIEWMHVLWVTVRDQIISPLIQGTLWALVSFYLSPFSARVGHGLVDHLPSRSTWTRKEGRGAGLLRD